jgi:UMP-CMP kinase
MPILDKLKEVFSSDKQSPHTATSPGAHADHPSSTAGAATATTAHSTAATAVTHERTSSGTAFNAHKVKVIFVLGGPGAGQ